jgi:hypothetical protein
MISTLHRMGLRSSAMYMAGVASIGLAAASWFISRNFEAAGRDRADRWGLFIGEWAPTFFSIGVALRIEETHAEKPEISEWQEQTAEETMRRPSRAGV